MDDTRDQVTAIVPVWNGERYLGEAITSIVTQGHKPLDLLVVDDGSTDGSAAVAQSFPEVRYHRQENGGTGSARNLGVTLATGALVAFLDSDDTWMPGKLALQVAAMAADPELDIVLGHVQQFVSPELDEDLRQKLHCPEEPTAGYCLGAMLVRRNVFERVGPFSTTLVRAETVDWCLRAKDLGVRFRVLPEVVMRRRLHGENQSMRLPGSTGDYAHALKAHLLRMRAKR